MTDVRLLTESDGFEVLELLKLDTTYNGLILSDLKRDHNSLIAMYGGFFEENLVGCLFIFADKIAYFGDERLDVAPFVPYISSSNVKKMVGKASLIDKFVPLVNVIVASESFILELKEPPLMVEDARVKVCWVQSEEELRGLYQLFRQVEEYASTDANVESWVQGQLKALTLGTTRIVYADVEGEMVSTASSIGETGETAILAGVATPPQYRNRGYASVLVSALSNDVIRDGKTMYLFYNNPAAGAIYKKLGFHEGGPWKVLHLG